jgi:NSS family neurotransmitter:Na+ symporter
VTTYSCIIGLIITLIFTIDSGNYLLSIVDSFLTSIGILLSIILEVFIFSWFVGLDKLLNVLNKNSTIKIGIWWKIVLKYITLIILVFVWIDGIISNTIQENMFINLILTMILIIIPLILTKSSLRNDMTNIMC